jgi:hypothetical protein
MKISRQERAILYHLFSYSSGDPRPPVPIWHKAPKARNVSACIIFLDVDFAPSGLHKHFWTFSRGVAPGYYISRLQREDEARWHLKTKTAR